MPRLVRPDSALHPYVALQLPLEIEFQIELARRESKIRASKMPLRFGEWSPLNQVSAMSDFFTLNETRDLLFHVQEQNFTIARISRPP